MYRTKIWIRLDYSSLGQFCFNYDDDVDGGDDDKDDDWEEGEGKKGAKLVMGSPLRELFPDQPVTRKYQSLFFAH